MDKKPQGPKNIMEKIKKAYKVLEIEESAPVPEIKKKYRDLVKKYHPDKETGDLEKFREIDESYKLILEKLSEERDLAILEEDIKDAKKSLAKIDRLIHDVNMRDHRKN